MFALIVKRLWPLLGSSVKNSLCTKERESADGKYFGIIYFHVNQVEGRRNSEALGVSTALCLFSWCATHQRSGRGFPVATPPSAELNRETGGCGEITHFTVMHLLGASQRPLVWFRWPLCGVCSSPVALLLICCIFCRVCGQIWLVVVRWKSVNCCTRVAAHSVLVFSSHLISCVQ